MEDRQVLWVVFIITLLYLIVEIIVGVTTQSLALIADAVHMFTDSGALALAAFAAWIASKPVTMEKTYGYYRSEILAALVNALVLIGSAIYIVYQAYQRLMHPAQVQGWPMMIAAVLGLVVNLVAIWLLHTRSEENLNVKGAFYEVVKDALGSIGVIVAGVVILTTGFNQIDPIISVLIAVMILPRTWLLLKDAVNVLLEGVPGHLNLDEIKQTISQVENVESVHDLHVWTISSGRVALSGHVVVLQNGKQVSVTLDEIIARLKTSHDIEHTTIQIELRDSQNIEPAW